MSGQRLFTWGVVVNEDSNTIIATSAYEYYGNEAARQFKAQWGAKCAPLSVHEVRRAKRPRVGAAFRRGQA